MQGYDLIMIVVLAMATIFGAIKGFAWQVASLASILVSYLVAVNFRNDLAERIQATPPWNIFLAMLILYVATSFVIWVGFRLLSGAIDRVRLKEFDRHLGAAFGLAKGCVFCLLITMFAMTLLGPKQQEAICRSRSGFYIATALDSASGILPKELHEVVGPYLERLDQQLSQTAGTAQSNPANPSWMSQWFGSAPPESTHGGQPPMQPGQANQPGWNLWPGGSGSPPGTSPAVPAGVSPPAGISPPAGSTFGNGFGFDPNQTPGLSPTLPPTGPVGLPPTLPPTGTPAAAPNLQQAQQPGLNWPR